MSSISGSATLGRSELLGRIQSGDIFISPMPEARSVGKGTVNLSVGTLFLVGKRSAHASVRSGKPPAGSSLFNEVRIEWGRHIVLQPRQMILASTLEYLRLPLTVGGLLQSRSSFGRMGLFAGTSPWIGPGWKGCPTLELSNTGDVAVEVRPGDPICQMLFLTAQEEPGPPSRYQFSTRPYFAVAESDDWLNEIDGWCGATLQANMR
jgi:deoxycytidine triphosphate deaminase